MSTRSRVSAALSLSLLSTALAGALVAPVASAAPGDATSFALPPAPSSVPGGRQNPTAITSTTDGDLWMTLLSSGFLASMTTSGVATARPVAGLTAAMAPTGIAQDRAGRIWFTETAGNAVSSVTTSATDLRRIALPKPQSGPSRITVGPDGNMWFTETSGNRIGRVTAGGSLTEFDLPAGSQPVDIAAHAKDWLAFTMPGRNAIGRVTLSGAVTSTTLPTSGSDPAGIAVDARGSIWFTEFSSNRIGRLSAAGALAEFTVPTADSGPLDIAVGPDGAVWFTEYKAAKIARITDTGAITEFPIGAKPLAITAGADGNIWVTDEDSRVTRILTGVTPTSSAAPAISGTSTAIGAVLTTSNGTWSAQPTGYALQWQRCTANDGATCADIAGAKAPTYTIAAADSGTWLRTRVTAANLNGPTTAPAASALLQMGAKPTPAPVVGSPSAAIAPGVTATFRAVTKTKRKVLRSYRVAFTSGDVRGKVRMSLVNSAGAEVLVIAKGRWVRSTGPTALAKRWKRIPRSVPRGTYTLRAVFTPQSGVATTYSVATLTRTLVVR